MSARTFRPVRRIALGLAAAVCGTVAAGLPAHAMPLSCPVPANRDITVTRTVFDTGHRLGVSDKVLLAGFETGWVESHMNNLSCGDRDSLGVFQQRPSEGWGTPEEIMDVAHAATSFFTRAVNAENKHPGYTAGQVAQAVQVSAFPSRYDEAQPKALSLLAELRPPAMT
ncbi:hypothetical protein ACIG5F_49250, partial [Kutzneria sp. NPDC052558]